MNQAKIEKINLYLCRFSSGGLNYSTWKNSKNYVIAYELISNGLSGWGESTLKYRSMGVALRKAKSLVGKNVFNFEKAFDGDFFSDIGLYQSYVGLNRRVRQVREGFSMAFWDLAGKLSEKPAYELLKRPAIRSQVEGLAVIHVQEPEVMKEIAQTWYDDGFRNFKLKIRGDVQKDARAIELVKSIGSDLQILIVDANYGYRERERVIEAGKVFSELGVGYFQNPIRRPLRQYPQLQAQMQLPFTSDNTSYWPNIRRVLRHDAAKLVNLHPNCIGGVDYLYKIVDYAKSKSVPCIMGGSGFIGIQDKCFQKMAFSLDSGFPSEEIGLPQYFNSKRKKYYQHEFDDPSVLSNDLQTQGSQVFDRDEFGFGIEVDREKLKRVTEQQWSL